jgi:hypothetical protein
MALRGPEAADLLRGRLGRFSILRLKECRAALGG